MRDNKWQYCQPQRRPQRRRRVLQHVSKSNIQTTPTIPPPNTSTSQIWFCRREVFYCQRKVCCLLSLCFPCPSMDSPPPSPRIVFSKHSQHTQAMEKTVKVLWSLLDISRKVGFEDDYWLIGRGYGSGALCIRPPTRKSKKNRRGYSRIQRGEMKE